MSISKSQAEALRDGLLDNLGSKPPGDQLSVIDAMLSLAAKEFIITASNNLEKANAVSSGDLQSDLRFEVETNGGTYTMSVGYKVGSPASKYFDFTNKGVQGVKKPGRAPRSPYKFRFLGVSQKHAYAIEQWYRRSGRSVSNVNPSHPASRHEAKGIRARHAQKKSLLARVAYATARKTKREGLKPTHYFDDAVHDVLGAGFIRAMEVALGGEVIISIRQAQL